MSDVSTTKIHLIFLLLTFALGFVIGARTYHPAYLIEYKALQPEIDKCQQQFGNFRMEGNRAICEKTQAIFDFPVNTSYFKAQ